MNHELPSKRRFPEMLEHGANVAIGSDATDWSNFTAMVLTMYLAAVLPKDYRNDAGISCAEDAIEVATINGAEVIGADAEIGSFDSGKKAALMVIKHTPAGVVRQLQWRADSRVLR